MALRFASAAAGGFPAPVSISSRTAQVFRGRVADAPYIRSLDGFPAALRRSGGALGDVCEVVPCRPSSATSRLDTLVRCPPIKCHCFLRSAEDIGIQIPQLQ